MHFIAVDAGNVGAARAAGFEYSRTVCGEHLDPDEIWYATTDADYEDLDVIAANIERERVAARLRVTAAIAARLGR